MLGICSELVACGGGSSSQLSNSSTSALPNVVSAIPIQTVPVSEVDGSNNATPSSQANTTKPVTVELTYHLPTSANVTATPSFAAQSTAYRRLKYISASNTLISIAVTPLGGATTTSSGSCTSTTCVVNFTATPGPNTLVFTLTDTGGNVLSTFTTVTNVQPSTLNTLKFTANPVVHNVGLQLTSTSVNAGSPANDLLSVNAMDADGNTIVGNSSYIDAQGNPVTLFLNVTNNQSGGRGTVTIQGPTAITAPGQAAIYAHYDGYGLVNSQLSVTSTSQAIASLTGATLTITPTAYLYTTSSRPESIVAGPDGNMWYTQYGTNKVSKMSTNGTVLGSYSTTDDPGTIIVGPDGNMWFLQGTTTSSVVSMSTSGTILKSFTVPTASAFQSTTVPNSLIIGPDGNLWFSEYSAAKIASVTTQGVFSESQAVYSHPEGMTIGPNGNVLVTNTNSASVSQVAVTGSYSNLTVPTGPTDIVVGSDGNFWVTSNSTGTITRLSPTGSVTNYSTNDTLRGITLDSAGNVWFADQGASYIGTVAYNCTSSCVTEYSISVAPFSITLGPDGNLWAASIAAAKIIKFVI